MLTSKNIGSHIIYAYIKKLLSSPISVDLNLQRKREIKPSEVVDTWCSKPSKTSTLLEPFKLKGSRSEGQVMRENPLGS